MRDLGTLGGTGSSAIGINDAGQVVGDYFTAGDVSHAFITGPNGMGMRDVGIVGGYYSTARGINDAGQVVGWSQGEGSPHSFITGPDGTGTRDLGTLGETGLALGINDAGQVVGWSIFSSGSSQHAFVTGPNGEGMMDLNSLVDLPAGVILQIAYGINNAGQVIAVGTVPEPESYALFLAGLALVGFIARRKKMGGEAVSLG